VSDHYDEYRLQHHFEGRRRQLMEEARQARLKAEILRQARQPARARRLFLSLFVRLRAALRMRVSRPIVPDRTTLESTVP
jgi:hypothetical protein